VSRIHSNLSALRNPDGTRVLCRHCAQTPVTRPRGLCWHCYHTPGVKDLYPITSKFARRSYADFHRQAPLPEPTTLEPGSPEKLDALCDRARLGQSLFHPAEPCVGVTPQRPTIPRAKMRRPNGRPIPDCPAFERMTDLNPTVRGGGRF
jgi:hypothetical protein